MILLFYYLTSLIYTFPYIINTSPNININITKALYMHIFMLGRVYYDRFDLIKFIILIDYYPYY